MVARKKRADSQQHCRRKEEEGKRKDKREIALIIEQN